ncbi:Hypothetical predicted protein [Paramuricea clavata]|uniref:Uncharacterized protein n=1 Tax=Paramuricea clavata TaxID=317549 RepID=A0A6S7FZI4_PARCT|nr:Hypothetical predicted protein [Paramuricea clavata]
MGPRGIFLLKPASILRSAVRIEAEALSEDSNARSGSDSKQVLLEDMEAIGFDGSSFVKNLEASVADRQKRGKPPRKIRYVHYCQWAHALLKKDIGGEDAEFGFPCQVLNFIRHIAPGDVKGEIREDAYSVSLKVFCKVLDIPERQKNELL